MRIDVGKADPLPDAASPKQAAEHDAAVATEDHDEALPVEPVGECFAERPTVLRDLCFVTRPAGWPIEVAVRGRCNVAEVGGPESLHQAKGAKRCRRPVDVLWLTGPVIGPKADAGWGSEDRDVHGAQRNAGFGPFLPTIWPSRLSGIDGRSPARRRPAGRGLPWRRSGRRG